MNFQQRIEKLHNHLYANSGFRTPSAIGAEVGKLLHCAFYIEENNGGLPAFGFQVADMRLLEQGDPSICDPLLSELQQVFTSMNSAWGLYESSESILLSSENVGHAASCLGNILLSDKTQDYYGDALEIFRSTWAKREGGQFFTDQQVTRLALDMIDFDPRNGDDLVDVCAGTGGFLLAGLNRIRRLVEEDGSHSDEQLIAELARESLHGREVDPQVAAIANATMAARLSSKITDHMISIGDSLADDLGKHLKEGTHRCIATNPPFGTKITVKAPDTLARFELARSNGRLVPRAPDTLFVEQNVRLLIPGEGRGAIVIPFQIMSGPQAYFIRDWLLRHVRLHAVVDLPADTFQPHTGTKASLLVFSRREQPLKDLREDDSGDVFMSLPEFIGHDRRGKTTYLKDKHGRQTDTVRTDIPDVGRAYSAFIQGNEPNLIHSRSFKVSMKRILQGNESRLNASYYLDDHHSAPDKTDTVRLGDLVERVFFPGRFKRSYVPETQSSVPFLGGANITELVVNTHKFVSLSDPYYDQLAVRPGWVLVTRSGSTGIVSSVPEAWNGFAISEHVIRIVPNESRMAGGYLEAVLRSSYGQAYLKRGVFGSVIDEISTDYLLDMPIPLLPKETQAEIVQQMKAYDQGRQIALDALASAMRHL